ncbi:unnamed protein product [Sympodiomycopsis kandeliae]
MAQTLPRELRPAKKAVNETGIPIGTKFHATTLENASHVWIRVDVLGKKKLADMTVMVSGAITQIKLSFRWLRKTPQTWDVHGPMGFVVKTSNKSMQHICSLIL